MSYAKLLRLAFVQGVSLANKFLSLSECIIRSIQISFENLASAAHISLGGYALIIRPESEGSQAGSPFAGRWRGRSSRNRGPQLTTWWTHRLAGIVSYDVLLQHVRHATRSGIPLLLVYWKTGTMSEPHRTDIETDMGLIRKPYKHS